MNINNEEKKKEKIFFDKETMRDDIIQFSFEVVKNAKNKYEKKKSMREHSQSHEKIIQVDTSSFHTPIKILKFVQPTILRLGKNNTDYFGTAQKDNEYLSHDEGARRTVCTSRKSRQCPQTTPQKLSSQQLSVTKQSTINKIQKNINHYYAFSQGAMAYNNRRHKDELKNEKNMPIHNEFREEKRHKEKLIKQKDIQNWLNEVLIQISPNQEMNKKQIENFGLVYYQIDKNQLLKAGIHPCNINRLYRAFYVYSQGFYNLLDELCHKNQQLQQKICQIFTLLLQHSSYTMVGKNLQDKTNLKNKMQTDKKSIEKNDEAQIQSSIEGTNRHIKSLNVKIKNLSQQRDAFIQKLTESQQAFNEQVLLRIQFQSKINQIHALHSSLTEKYHLLKEECLVNNRKYQNQQSCISQLTQQIMKLKCQLQLNKQTIKDYQPSVEYLRQALQQKSHNLIIVTEKLRQAKFTLQNLSTNDQDKNKQIAQLSLNLQNIQSSQKCSAQIIKTKGQQLINVLKQHQLLHQHIHKNFIDINRLSQENRQLGYKTIQMSALMALESKKLKQKQKQMVNAKRLIDKLGQQTKIMEVNYKAEKDRAEALEQDVQIYIKNIKQLKAKQIQAYTMLQQANRNIKNLQQTIQTNKQDSKKYQIQRQQYKIRISEIKHQQTEYEKRAIFAQQSNKYDNKLLKSQLKKMNEELEKIKEKCEKIQQEKEIYLSQIQCYKEKYEKISVQFKDQKFEKKNIALYYKQSLAVMEEQISHIKELNIQISQMEQTNAQLKRKYNNLQFIHSQKTHFFEEDLKFWKNKYQTSYMRTKQRQHYIHPLVYEDLRSDYLRLKEQVINLQQKLKKQTILLNNMKSQKFHQLQQLQNNSILQEDLNKKSLKLIAQRNQMIEYLKQKLSYQINKLKENQQDFVKAQSQKNKALQMLRSKQLQSMNIINQKNTELKELSDKYRNLLQLKQQQLKNQKVPQKMDKSSNQIKSPQKWYTNNKTTSQWKKQKKESKTLDFQSMKLKNPKINQNQILNNHSKIYLQNEGDVIFDNQFVEGVAINQNNSYLAEQNWQRREDIRKKIKGAYLYYLN